MGLSLEFYLGDERAIEALVRAGEPVPLRDPAVVAAYADMSLHLEPRDLDLLSRAIGTLGGGGDPRALRPSLRPIVDTAEYGLLAVEPGWVAYVADRAALAPETIAEAWAAAMRELHGDAAIVTTPAMVTSVAALLSLSRQAHAAGRGLLHGWAL